MKVDNRKILLKQLFFIAVTSFGVFIGFRYVLPLVFPFIIAYWIMRLIYPFVKWMKRKLHIPIMLGGGIALILTLGVIGGIIFYIGSVLFEQLQQLFRNIPVFTQMILTNLDKLCLFCDGALGMEKGQSSGYLYDNMNSLIGVVQNVGIPMMSQHTMNLFLGVFAVFGIIFIIIFAVFNMVIDYEEIRESYRKTLLYKTICPVTSKLGSVGIAYVKTQLTIMLINSIILVAGFYFTGSEYAWLAGIGIAFMDAFPIIGSGLFLVPLAIIRVIGGRYVVAAVLITLYGCCELIRSLVEPRLLGNRIGLKPIYTFMSMYIGVELFGVTGFLLGPLALVIIRTILQETHCLGVEEDK